MTKEIQELQKEYLKYATGPALKKCENKAMAKKIKKKIKRLKRKKS